jgi:dihydrofolate reductase
MKVIGIVAVARNGVMGRDLDLPWNIPEDMRWFRQSTRGHVVVMGRKTFDSLKKPLPNRENLVITRDPEWKFEGVRVFHELGAAIDAVKKERENQADIKCFVLGGAQIFAIGFSLLDELWMTEIQNDIPGNILFPDYRDGKLLRPEFRLAETLPQKEDHPENLHYSFNKYLKVTPLAK